MAFVFFLAPDRASIVVVTATTAKSLTRTADVCVYSGTASVVMPAMDVAREGARVITIEPSPWLSEYRRFRAFNGEAWCWMGIWFARFPSAMNNLR